jgi:2OG-Fe(II) oxygenase superfamily
LAETQVVTTGEGSFFKAHVDTPRNETMFGSIVIVLPTSHEGGVLVFRHRGQEWYFDSSAILSAAMPASIAYAAFFCDVEHEILPVKSGHRVTLTYNLHFEADERASGKHLVSELPSIPQEENEQTFRWRFKALLENPEFLPDGGTLGFGLRHVYQVKDTLEHVYSILKGNDGTVYQSLRELGFEPILYLHFEEKDYYRDETVLMDRIPELSSRDIGDLDNWLHNFGGISIPYDEEVTWVTPETAFNAFEREFTYGNEPEIGLAYGNLCLIVRIGSVGQRLIYPTGTQMRAR